MKFSHAATLLVLSGGNNAVSAFQLTTKTTSLSFPTTVRPSSTATIGSTRRYAVAIDVPAPPPAPKLDEDAKEVIEEEEPAFDMTGIALSGLEGQALKWKESDFPQARELRAVIPKDCFESDTKTSLKYLSVSVIGTTLCTLMGTRLLSVLPPSNIMNVPFWSLYSAVTGTVAMGLWVLAHECGHGAFSKNKTIQDTIGFWLHSFLLVPYYSWQRSHAVHHQYTNHMELGETHVPEKAVTADNGKEGGSLGLRNLFYERFGSNKMGLRAWGALQGTLHLFVGWPAYLLIGATGGPDRGLTNHFLPNPLTKPNKPNKELFPGNWKKKVLKADLGVATAVAGIVAWTVRNGFSQMMALYGGPLIVVNAWLIIYTWYVYFSSSFNFIFGKIDMCVCCVFSRIYKCVNSNITLTYGFFSRFIQYRLQHTDVDVPHFSSENHNFVKGALHTIDRPYDKLDPWGVIDFLHHKIGTTHVAHHFDSTIPHYKAEIATEAIKKAYPKMYLYDPTPIPQALWRISKGCTGVVKRGTKWIWNNKGVEALL
jgi:fatty acid desaturase